MSNLEQTFSGITKLGLDTSPLIYFIERHPVYLTLMRNIIRKIDTGEIEGYTSVVTLTEVLIHPKRLQQVTLEENYRTLLFKSRHFELVSIDAIIAEQAAELRAHYNLRTPDALQIAAILSVGCQAFLTNDKRLSGMTELQILILDDL